MSELTSGLIERDGILFAATEAPVSYPEAGNELYFRIEENSFWFKHRNACILSVVQRFAPHAHFFDVGGGNGFVSHGLQENGIRTTLIEPGLQGCVNARKRGLKRVVCTTLENAGLGQGTVPAMGLFDVVEHIDDDVSFLRSAYEVLEVGGTVFITVPAYNFLWSNEDVDAGHFRRHTVRGLTGKLKEVGFEVLYGSYFFSILTLPILLFRSIPSRLGMNKGSNDPDKHVQEHAPKKGLMDSLMNRVWSAELGRVKKGGRILFGSSCLLVARRVR
ncbi:MAG: methyltransferase domain-containing protein [Flavobacteriales bacterium]|nr:methyltransferase domain-containing protein [Flavobacteriales bacterium]